MASRSFFEVFGSCRSEHKDSLSPSRFCGGRGRLSGKMGMEDALELFVTYRQPLLPDWLGALSGAHRAWPCAEAALEAALAAETSMLSSLYLEIQKSP